MVTLSVRHCAEFFSSPMCRRIFSENKLRLVKNFLIVNKQKKRMAGRLDATLREIVMLRSQIAHLTFVFAIQKRFSNFFPKYSVMKR